MSYANTVMLRVIMLSVVYVGCCVFIAKMSAIRLSIVYDKCNIFIALLCNVMPSLC